MCHRQTYPQSSCKYTLETDTETERERERENLERGGTTIEERERERCGNPGDSRG